MKEEFVKRVKRIEDYNAIINCFNRYLQYYALHHKPGVLECFALDREDVSVEISRSGIFTGRAAVEDYYECLPRRAASRGVMNEQHCVAPVVQFAADGKTAKLTSLSSGMKVVSPARVQAWSWGKFYADFIETQAGWKIWHLHWFHSFEADMERGPLHTQFTQRIEKSFEEVAALETAEPTRPSSYFHLFDPKTRTYNMPEPQIPYETWDGMTDLVRSRPYSNPDRPESMGGEVQTVISLGRVDEGYSDT